MSLRHKNLTFLKFQIYGCVCSNRKFNGNSLGADLVAIANILETLHTSLLLSYDCISYLIRDTVHKSVENFPIRGQVR